MKLKSETENGFKQTEIGSIPEDWETAKINEAYSFTKKPPRIDLSKYKRIPFIPMEFVPDDGKDLNRYEFREKVSSGTFVCKGDLIVAKITPSFENGKQAIVRDIPFDFVYATTEVWPIHEIEGQSDIDYLFYYLKKPDVRNDVAGKMEGSTGRQRVPKNVLENLTIPFPTLKEQQKIASVLSNIQQAIEQQEKIIAKTKELKRSLMHRLFTYGLRGEELKETEIGLVPESWNLVSIGELIANKVLFIQNGFPCGKWNDKGIGILQLRPFNISDEGYINLNTVKHIQTDKKIDSYLLRNEDVIFNNTNSEELVGKTALWQAEKEAVLSNHMTIIRILKKDKLVPLYLARLLHKKWFDKYFRSICQRHVNQASVGVERIKRVRLGLPSIAEQKEIASVFYQLDQKICNENIKKMNLGSFFKSMLQLLMTGRVRVKDIDFGEACE